MDFFRRKKSNPQYFVNCFGDEIYPTARIGGSEYYLYGANGEPLLAHNRHGVERYAQDRFGNELYPKSKQGIPFIRPHPIFGHPVYARDASANEVYPKVNGCEVMAVLSNGEMLVARYVTGRQRYPLDRDGDAYFPLRKTTREPYYLLDENKIAYRPVTADGCEMYLRVDEIPEEATNVSAMKDALGSTVYKVDYKMKRKSIWATIKERCVERMFGYVKL